MSSTKRRVVVTGMGLISPLGHSASTVWEALSAGRSGVQVLSDFPIEPLSSDIGGQCTQFRGEIEDFGELDKQLTRQIKRGLKLMCRDIKLGVAAAQHAFSNAGLEPGQYDPATFGTLFGCDYVITQPADYASGIHKCMHAGQFDFSRWGSEGLPAVEPLWLLKYLPNMPASHVAIFNDLQGPSNSLTMREASSNLAVAEAATIIARGTADRMIAGATGSRIHPLKTVHLALQESLASRQDPAAQGDPAKACRPFDRDRTGMVLGEGAAALVLEELEVAQARGATILAEVVGYGSSMVGPEQPHPFQTALANVLHGILETAQWTAKDVGHVHAHGLGSTQVDQEEAAAIAEVLGDRPVTAAKSYMGNLGAGSGLVETITSLLALQQGQLFPILNCDNLDPACPIHAVTSGGVPAGESFINLNVTPQGQASGVALQKFAG